MKTHPLESVSKIPGSTAPHANCKQLLRKSEQFLKKDSELSKQFSPLMSVKGVYPSFWGSPFRMPEGFIRGLEYELTVVTRLKLLDLPH